MANARRLPTLAALAAELGVSRTGVPEAERAGLTTVRQPVREKGRAAGRLLLARAEPTRSRTVSLPPELMIGTSSGPAGRGGAP